MYRADHEQIASMIETKVNSSFHLDNSRRLDDSRLDNVSFYDVDLRQGLDPNIEKFVNYRLEKLVELTN
jgi:hypothetical protein